MKTLKSIAQTAIIMGVLASATAANAAPSEYLGEVRATANDICTGIEDLDTNRSRLEIKGKVKASLGSFLSKIISIPSVDVSAEYEKESGKGLLTSQILPAIGAGVVQGDKCKLDVFKTLVRLPIIE